MKTWIIILSITFLVTLVYTKIVEEYIKVSSNEKWYIWTGTPSFANISLIISIVISILSGLADAILLILFIFL